VLVNDGLERILDYAGVRLERFNCTVNNSNSKAVQIS